ncbi:MAG TPA: DoxX family protein [Bacteroidota bacterium]|nr:DoxX family protein [Bacteroidota bacterium]
MLPSFTQLSLALFLLRIVLGVVFFAHGAQKVFGWFGGYGLTGTVGYFKNVVHVPAPLAYLGPFVEFLGGIALVLGLFTKFAALGIFIMMLVATLKVHLPMGFFLSGKGDGKGQGYEFTLTLAVISLVLVLLGGGVYSIDNLI